MSGIQMLNFYVGRRISSNIRLEDIAKLFGYNALSGEAVLQRVIGIAYTNAYLQIISF